MDEAQIYARLAAVFEDVLDQESVDVRPDAVISDMDGWDSLTNIRLTLTIEKVFNIKSLSSEMDKLQSVGRIGGRS